jgi:hypothetical protein
LALVGEDLQTQMQKKLLIESPKEEFHKEFLITTVTVFMFPLDFGL